MSTIGLLFACAVTSHEAQWLNHRNQRSSARTADGKPNLSAPAPRVDGKPDLSGVWQAERTPVDEFVRVLGPAYPQLQIDLVDVTKNFVNVFWGLKPEEEPLRPERARLLLEQHRASGRRVHARLLSAREPARDNLAAGVQDDSGARGRSW